MNLGPYVTHEAYVYKTRDGSFEVICQSRGCRFRLSDKDIRPATAPFTPATYEMAQREADRHSRARFR